MPPPDRKHRSVTPITGATLEQTSKVSVLRSGPPRRVVSPTLRVIAGRDLLRYVTLAPGDEIYIGRDDSAGLVLSDHSVSRRHARVRCDERGAVWVEDLGSTNGTMVNGTVIQRAALNAGDHLDVGVVSLRLDMLGPEELAHLQGVIARLEATNRDPLTGLLTRAGLDADLDGMVSRARNLGVPMSALLFDVDWFKRVNDHFGHLVGDDTLRAIARLVLVGLREGDRCYRYGGEEMLVLLDGVAERTALEVADRVRRSVEVYDWSRTTPGRHVTVSVGVAEWRPGDSARDWIERADRALYRAKALGRNRAVAASAEPAERA